MSYDAADNDIQKAVLTTMQEAAEEMQLTRRAADDLIKGLEFLRDQSNGKFTFKAVKPTGNSDIAFLIDPAGAPLGLTVNALGEITRSDKTDGSKAEAFNKTEVRGTVYDPDYRAEVDAQYEASTGIDPNADINADKNADKNAGLEETDAAAVLTDIAKRAVFDGQISPKPNYESFTGSKAQQAVVDGIMQAAEEIKLARSAADEIIKGLEFIRDQSNGNFNFHDFRRTGTSNVEINVDPTASGRTRAWMHLTVNAAGKIKSPGSDAEYDALKEADVNTLLSGFARTAALYEQVSPMPGDQDFSGNTAQKAVLAGFRAAADEITQARLAAEGFIRGLEFLQDQSNGGFSFETVKSAGRSDVVLQTEFTVDKGYARVPLTATVNASGRIQFNNGARYDASNKASVAEAVSDITKRSVFHGQVSPGPKGPGRS